ncbi:leucine-rich repeat protein [Butyrivibrio sp. WCE2006]|uniref:leucine-rich repeat protein n=1 Tax=Butyrivibrio sp. WCE2006 TaxID=1410611 RepID=UPI0005D27DE7|nr:leucine-rich repeat protein [Butyrivibrio sp. WCE2006]
MKKRIVTAFACLMLAAALPMSVHAEEGDLIHGYSTQQQATELSYNTHYYEEAVTDNASYFYKFKTGKDEGVYLLSFATKIKCGDKKTNGKTTVQIKDQYGTVIKEATGGDGVSYREDGGTRIIDIVMPVSGLEKEKFYYIHMSTFDGDSTSRHIDVVNKLCVKFVPFVPAGDFKAVANPDGSMTFTWNNEQKANTYNSLCSYDGFQLELKYGDSTRTKYIGNGGVKTYTLKANDPDLLALGYPANKIRIRLGSIQNYRSALESTIEVSNCVYSPTEYYTIVVPKNAQAKSDGFTYKITNVKGDGTGTVTVTGLTNKNSVPKTLKIPDKVTIGGIPYLVTEIEKNAFKGNAKIKNLEIGSNITRIRKAAFCDCKNLKNIRFKTLSLNIVGKDAFKNVQKKAFVYCPDRAHKTAYKKLLKKKITAGAKYKL